MIDRLYIAGMLALIVGGTLGLLWLNSAYAQTAPVPGYEGGGFAWDYPVDEPYHAGFTLTIDGVVGSTQIGKAVRQILFADTALKGQPLGKTYTAKLIATATSPAKNSAPAIVTFEYLARPQLRTPTNTRTILEWRP
jgi:hypothetical protein